MGADPIIPDLAATPSVVRKRRAPKHDFKDGKGKVFAHRHDNGGGWVADTAYVAPGVRVTRNAAVFDFAKVYDDCQIMGSSQVYGHARLFDSVQLSKNARVCGGATVCDTVQLHDTAVISHMARVFGNSRLMKRAIVSGNALVDNTYIQGTGARGELTIAGSCRVSDSRLYGYTHVGGNAVVDGTTLRNVCAMGEAKLIDSNLSTDTSWQESCVLEQTESTQRFYPDRSEGDVLLSISRRRSIFHNTMLDTTIASSGVSISNNVTIINSRMHMRYTRPEMTMPDVVAFFEELSTTSRNIAFCNIEMLHDVSALRQYLQGGGGGGAGIPPTGPVTQPGYVPGGQTTPEAATLPNLESIRQRRLMRLEGENA